LVWLAWREFLKERERAADDLVLNAGARASDYAGHLLEIARTLQPATASAGAAVAMARRSQLEGRLLMILDSNVNRKAAARMAPFAAAALAAALVAPFAAVRAQDTAQPVVTPEMDATIRAAWAQKNQEVVDQAAAAYAQQRKYGEAQKLLETGLAIREQTSGPQSATYAAGLVKLGDLALRRRQPKEAEAFYTKAISLGDRPEVVPALLYLGMHQTDYEQAFGYFQRALNVDNSGPDATRALMWMALTRQRQDRIPDAEGFFNDAISRGSSIAAGNAMEMYARLMETQGRKSDADAMHARAQETWKANRPPATAVPAASTVYKVGGGTSAPSLLSKIEPEYSEEARAMKYSGTAVLSIEVGPDGLAYNIQPVKSLGFGLDQKAIEAIQQWKFNPGIKDGQPVTVKATIEVNFRLL
jgi:TonB family protein